MAFDKNVTAAPAGPDDAALSGSAYEIDLYTELSHFAELPPEKQRRLVAHPESQSTQIAGQHPAEGIGKQNAVSLVEGETGGFNPAVVYDSEDLFAVGEGSAELPASPAAAEGLRFSSPFPGVGSSPGPVFSGAPLRGACGTCGAEATSDDLFCMSCGGFTDEIASAPPIDPNCHECGLSVAADEIFCPGCGALLTAQ
jgi:hypothetical protein